MKRTALIIILALFTLNVIGQSIESNNLALKVEREDLSHKTSFAFKPKLRLKIKTLKGEVIVAKSYSLLDNSIVANALDTIALNDIRMIRGKVFGNADRKILGVGLAAAALPLLYFTALMAVYTGGSPLLATLPPAGFLFGGISLSGARRFKIANNWTFKIAQQ
jgi:hypothetical protein